MSNLADLNGADLKGGRAVKEDLSSYEPLLRTKRYNFYLSYINATWDSAHFLAMLLIILDFYFATQERIAHAFSR